MVNVININTDVDLFARAGSFDVGASIVKGHQILDGRNNVLNRQNRVLQRLLKTQLAVDLVTTDLGQVITLGVEVEVIEQQTCCFSSYLLARTQLAVDVFESFFLGKDGVLLQGFQDRGEPSEVLRDVFGGQTQCLQEDGDGLLALAVNSHADLVALVDLKLQPCTAARNHADRVNFFVAHLVERGVEINTRASHQLRHHNTLGAVDDEGSLFGHQGKVTHEDGLGFDFTSQVVHELSFDIQRCCVSLAALFTLIQRILLFFEVGVLERQLHRLARILDGRNLFEDFC